MGMIVSVELRMRCCGLVDISITGQIVAQHFRQHFQIPYYFLVTTSSGIESYLSLLVPMQVFVVSNFLKKGRLPSGR